MHFDALLVTSVKDYHLYYCISKKLDYCVKVQYSLHIYTRNIA